MKTMRELVRGAAGGDVIVTDVQVVKTDQGNILKVFLMPMEHADILGMTIDIPEEVVDDYDLQEFGRKWQSGWKNLGDHLRDQ